MMTQKSKMGFTYTVEVLNAKREVQSVDVVENLMPEEGANHVLSAVFDSGVTYATWYAGVYEGNYTPLVSDTMAAFPAAATECVAYAGATRPAITFGAVANGLIDNTGSVIEITFTAAKTVYGGFISSSAVKNGVTGVLMSAVRFPSPKVLDIDGILRITVGQQLISA